MRKRHITAEWKVKQGAGGWEIGYFACSNCGHKSGEDAPVCPQCKANMKKIK